MGVVKRQSFKFLIVNYIGVIIGLVATFTVYSDQKQLFGLWKFLFSSATLVSTFILLGSSNIAIQYFPEYRDSKTGHKGFLTFLLLLVGAGGALTTLIFVVFWDELSNFLLSEDDDPLIKKYVFWTIPIACLVGLSKLLTNYIANFKRIVVPSIFNNVWQKISLPILILAIAGLSLSVDYYVWGIAGIFLVINLGMFIYLGMLGELTISFPSMARSWTKLKEVMNYGAYGMMSSFGAILATNIDVIFISKMVDVLNAGVYGILSVIINIMLIPRNAIYKITGPMVSNYITKNQIDKVDEIYKSSSLNLMVFCVGLFLLIYMNILDLIAIMPKSREFHSVLAVVLFLGLARLVDSATTINSHIIMYSKYFRFNLVALSVLALSNLAFNYIFISQYGITGAALAALVSLALFNLFKCIYIYVKFKIQPFTWNSFYLVLTGVSIYYMVYFIPISLQDAVNDMVGHVLNIVIRSFIIIVLYITLVWKLNISPEAMGMIKSSIRKGRNIVGM